MGSATSCFCRRKRKDSPQPLLVAQKPLPVLSGSYDNFLRLWNGNKASSTAALAGHRDSVWCVSVDWQSRQALTGSTDGTLKRWELDSERCVDSLQTHKQFRCFEVAWQTSLAFSGFHDGSFALWDFHQRVPLFQLPGNRNNDAVRCLGVDWKEMCAVSASSNVLQIWDLEQRACVQTLEAGPPVLCISVEWSSWRALTGSDDGSLKLWNLDAATCLQTIPGHANAIRCMSVDWKEHRALTGSDDKTLKQWDLEVCECIRTFKGHSNSVWCLAVDWNSMRAVTGSRDETLKVWDLDGTTCDQTLKGHLGAVMCVAADFGKPGAIEEPSTPVSERSWASPAGANELDFPQKPSPTTSPTRRSLTSPTASSLVE